VPDGATKVAAPSLYTSMLNGGPLVETTRAAGWWLVPLTA
jgi:hypothetical protein